MGKTQKHQSKGAASLDSQQDSSADGAEGDYVTLATVRELLKVQESTFKSLFESMIQSLTLRVDSVVTDVQEMKTSLQYTQKDVEELKPLHVKLEDVNKELDKISKDHASYSQKMEYLENQSRRNNIRVNGIPESDNETWEDAEVKVKRAIKEKLDQEVDIERAHRVERRKTKSGQANQNQPRTIVCRLRDWKQREQVLRRARKEKPADLYISEDLSPVTLQKRESQIPKLKAAKEAGKIAYFVLDRLIIKDRIE